MALPSLAPPPPVARPRVLVVGSTLATAATVMVFVGLVGVYLLERATVLSNGGDWIPSGSTIPLTQPNVMMLGLLMTSVTIQWVLQAVRNDDRVNTYLSLGLTLAIGLAFLNMAFYLYTLMALDIDGTSSAALLIYAITGAHIVMVMVAMAFLSLMAFRALGGQETSRQHDGLTAAAVFWQAMVAVYALIWIAIYVTK